MQAVRDDGRRGASVVIESGRRAEDGKIRKTACEVVVFLLLTDTRARKRRQCARDARASSRARLARCAAVPGGRALREAHRTSSGDGESNVLWATGQQ